MTGPILFGAACAALAEVGQASACRIRYLIPSRPEFSPHKNSGVIWPDRCFMAPVTSRDPRVAGRCGWHVAVGSSQDDGGVAAHGEHRRWVGDVAAKSGVVGAFATTAVSRALSPMNSRNTIWQLECSGMNESPREPGIRRQSETGRCECRDRMKPVILQHGQQRACRTVLGQVDSLGGAEEAMGVRGIEPLPGARDRGGQIPNRFRVDQLLGVVRDDIGERVAAHGDEDFREVPATVGRQPLR
jgi:hypothetical protein